MIGSVIPGVKPAYWLKELAAPYYAFKDASAEIVLVSPNGGKPPFDPTKSNEPAFQTGGETRRFEADTGRGGAMVQLFATVLWTA